jgi:hypothetical protein
VEPVRATADSPDEHAGQEWACVAASVASGSCLTRERGTVSSGEGAHEVAAERPQMSPEPPASFSNADLGDLLSRDRFDHLWQIRNLPIGDEHTGRCQPDVVHEEGGASGHGIEALRMVDDDLAQRAHRRRGERWIGNVQKTQNRMVCRSEQSLGRWRALDRHRDFSAGFEPAYTRPFSIRDLGSNDGGLPNGLPRDRAPEGTLRIERSILGDRRRGRRQQRHDRRNRRV